MLRVCHEYALDTDSTKAIATTLKPKPPHIPLSQATDFPQMTDFTYLPEQASHDATIDDINAKAFGPGRFARAAYRIREGGPHEPDLSFVALADGEVIASVRMTRVKIGAADALLLGPLAVRPAWKNRGIGRHILKMSVEAARRAGHTLVVLVGDEPYYGPLGFRQVPQKQMRFPAPVDEMRILALELKDGSIADATGSVRHADA
jgi:predicted N-acetyltransferase YhbS